MKSRESSQPKATNIIRPTKRGPSSVHSNSSERKIKVAPTNILEKPGFNIYTPKSNVTHRTGKAFTLPVTTSENNRPRLMPRLSGKSVSGSLSAEVYQRPVESYHKSNSTPTGNYSKHLTHSPMEARQGFNIIHPENRPEEKIYSIKTPKEESEEDTEEESEEEEEEEEESEEEESEEDDDPVMNEARTNRKIEDLELSLKSLLAVNNMLEATVKKQAQQILQLKKNSNGTQQVEPVQEVKEKETEEEEENDELFERIQKVTKEMIEQGKNCVEFEYKIAGRVLTNYALKEEEEEEEE